MQIIQDVNPLDKIYFRYYIIFIGIEQHPSIVVGSIPYDECFWLSYRGLGDNIKSFNLVGGGGVLFIYMAFKKIRNKEWMLTIKIFKLIIILYLRLSRKLFIMEIRHKDYSLPF